MEPSRSSKIIFILIACGCIFLGVIDIISFIKDLFVAYNLEKISEGTFQDQGVFLTIWNLFLSFGFILGGIIVLNKKDWARKLLIISSGLGLMTFFYDSFEIFINFKDIVNDIYLSYPLFHHVPFPFVEFEIILIVIFSTLMHLGIIYYYLKKSTTFMFTGEYDKESTQPFA